MGTQGPMADPHLGWREVKEEVPCSEGQDGEEDRKDEKGTGQGTGAQKPLAPSFLPAWLALGSTAPDIWGGGKSSSPCVQDVGLSSRPGVRSERRDMTPKARPTHLSKLRACGGRAERGRRAHGERPPGPSPIFVPVPCSLGAEPYLHTSLHSIGQHLLQGAH